MRHLYSQREIKIDNITFLIYVPGLLVYDSMVHIIPILILLNCKILNVNLTKLSQVTFIYISLYTVQYRLFQSKCFASETTRHCWLTSYFFNPSPFHDPALFWHVICTSMYSRWMKSSLFFLIKYPITLRNMSDYRSKMSCT